MSADRAIRSFDRRGCLTDLVTWAEKRPAWQRDAIRRLVTETLDDQAIAVYFAVARLQWSGVIDKSYLLRPV